MRRSTSVTVAGALLIAGGIFLSFGALMGALGQWMIRSMPLPNMPKTEVPLAPIIFVFVWEGLLAAWAIITAIGIFRLRRWAWISMLVFSGVMTAFATFGVIGMAAAMPLMKAMPPTPGLPPNFETIALLGVMGTLAVPLGCGIWWLILFTRKSVRLQFHGSSQEPLLPASQTAVAVAAVGPGAPGSPAPKIPVSILVIGVYLVAFVPFFPFALVMPYVRRMPVMLFGRMMWQGHAWIYMLTIGLAHLVIGVGLLTRKEWAWIWACAYALFMAANSLAFVVTPHSFDRMLAALRQTIPDLADMFTAMAGFRSMYYAGMIPGLGLPIVALYFLWTRREAYRLACEAKG